MENLVTDGVIIREIGDKSLVSESMKGFYQRLQLSISRLWGRGIPLGCFWDFWVSGVVRNRNLRAEVVAQW